MTYSTRRDKWRCRGSGGVWCSADWEANLYHG